MIRIIRYTSCILFALLVYAHVSAQSVYRELSILKTADHAEKPAIYLSLSRYYTLTQPDSAVSYANLGIRMAEANHDNRSISYLLFQLGEINRQQNHKELARGFYNESMDIFRRLKDTQGLTLAYDALGVLDGNAADFNIAMQYEQDSRDTTDVSATYTAMGKMAEDKGETEKAISHYLRALALYERQKRKPAAYFTLLENIGRLYAAKGNTRIALHYLQEGIRDSLQQDETTETLRLIDEEGETFEKNGSDKDALNAYKQELTDARKYQQPAEQAEALLHIAELLKNTDNGSTITDLNEALIISKKIKQADLEARIYAALSAAYRQQKNYNNALFALQEQHRLLDSLLTADTVKNIRALDTSYALERSHEKVISLEAKNRNNFWLICSSLLILMVISGLMLLLWQSFNQVKTLNTELAASNRIKDTLFSVIGHDLKGPAASALQLFALLEDGDITESEMKVLIGDLRRQTNASLDLLQALFEWGRAQLQGIQVSSTDFSVSEAIEHCIRLLAGQAADKQLDLNATVPDNLKIHADANHFSFIIRNLIANAIKFSYPGGEINIAANATTANGEVIISVSDQGVGISKEQVALFHKANLKVSFGTRQEKGSGLGLLLAKDFIRANNGRIWLNSAEGKGTTFFISLPAA